MNSKEGAKKRWQTLIDKYGSEEAVREAMRGFRAQASPSRTGGFAKLKAEGRVEELKALSKKGLEARRGKH